MKSPTARLICQDAHGTKAMQSLDPVEPTAADYVAALKAHQSSEELKKILRHVQAGDAHYAEDDSFMGVRLGQVVELSRRFVDMEPAEIEKLLESPMHEVRVGAVGIMQRQARRKGTSEARRHELFRLYLSRLDRMNSSDLVDQGAREVVGRYLMDKPRDILHRLAGSQNPWHRRTAIVATWFFIQKNDLDDTYKVALALMSDDEPIVQEATGRMLSEAGKKDPKRLKRFLDEHATGMPRAMLLGAIAHLDKKSLERYLELHAPGSPSEDAEKNGTGPRKGSVKKTTGKKAAKTKKKAAGAKKKKAGGPTGTAAKKTGSKKVGKRPRKAAKKTTKAGNKESG